MTVSVGSTLTPNVIVRLVDSFAELNWPLASSQNLEGSPHRFSLFCQMLERLKLDEQQLVLDLLPGFRHCHGGDYRAHLAVTLQQNLPWAEQHDHVFIAPLIAPKDRGRAKSSQFAVYALKGEAERILRPKQATLLESPDELAPERRAQAGLVILVDDFIGTGDTAIEAIDEYEASQRVRGDELAVLAVVAQERGRDQVLGRAKFAARFIERRGISDSDVIGDKPAALSTMARIERELGVSTKLRLGYDASEALVSMERTPNNTFPVFWKPTDRRSADWPAPFERKQ